MKRHSLGSLLLLGLLTLSLLSAACSVGSVAGSAGNSPDLGDPPSGPEVGKRAPEFAATDLKGNKVTLANLRGKVVMLNFWATWCPYCRAEMPDMQRLQDAYRSRGLEVVALDVGEDAGTVWDYVSSKGFTFSVWLDLDGSISQAYAVPGYPTSYFIDRQGVIRSVQVGAMNLAAMDKHVKPLLEE